MIELKCAFSVPGGGFKRRNVAAKRWEALRGRVVDAQGRGLDSAGWLHREQEVAPTWTHFAETTTTTCVVLIY